MIIEKVKKNYISILGTNPMTCDLDCGVQRVFLLIKKKKNFLTQNRLIFFAQHMRAFKILDNILYA